MTSSEREGLASRIRQLRRQARDAASGAESTPDLGRLDALELRLAHLEVLLQGLQDSVYRESQRQEKRIGELEAQIHPAAIASALDRDARNRGL